MSAPVFRPEDAAHTLGKRPRRPTAVLGIDGAWGGLGWCVATVDGPRHAGWSAPGGKVDRIGAMRALIASPLELLARVGAGNVCRRVAIEEPPQVYGGRGNQFATGFGLGRAVGILELLAADGLERIQPLQGSPALLGGGRVDDTALDGGPHRAELVPVSEWRAWWRPMIYGPGADAWKASAIVAVITLGWGHLLPTGERKTDVARRGDVAEAILLAVGRARHSRVGGE